MTLPAIAYFVLSVYLSAVLLVSALAKLVSQRDFSMVLLRQGLLPRRVIWPASWLIPTAELCAAFVLASGTARVPISGAVLGLFVAFLVATAILAIQGKDAECGCFGVVFKERINAATIIRDIGFVSVAAGNLALVVAVHPAFDQAIRVAVGTAFVGAVLWTIAAPRIVPAMLARKHPRALALHGREEVGT